MTRKIQRYGWKRCVPDHNRATADTTGLIPPEPTGPLRVQLLGLDGDGYFLMPWTYILSVSLAGAWTTIVRTLAD